MCRGLTLLTMRSWLLLGVLVLGVLGGVLVGNRMGQKTSYQVRVDTLVKEAVRLDTLWRERKVRYTAKMATYDTVRMTDTVVRNDTVFIPREVADSAISSCRAVVTTCELQKANLTARLALAESTIAHRDVKPVLWAAGVGMILGLILR